MLRVHSFVFNPFQENTYLLISDSGDCAIIDPGCYSRDEEKVLVDFVENEKLNPVMLLNTHCHIDHVFGNKFVAATFGLRPIIPKDERIVFDTVPRVAEMYGLNYDPSPEPAYFESDIVEISGNQLKILNVPGHSPGHVAFYAMNDGFVISGDALFKQSIGRTDLPGGDFQTLMMSIQRELLVLPDETEVYAGHMEPTDIGSEKKYNPFINQLYQG